MCVSHPQILCELHPEETTQLQALAKVTYFFFITLQPGVIHKSMSLKCEPSSEPIHIR